MKIYSLYYCDKEYLEPWLNHYCHIPCIEEILIQDQNWSPKNSLHLYKTIANYIDEYDVKIVILPSNYCNPDPTKKRAQFLEYGQPTIRNRVTQFLKGAWILGALDEVIYGESYIDTHKKLHSFEKWAKRQPYDVAGYVQLFSVIPEHFRPGGDPTIYQEHWKHRVTYNIHSLQHRGQPIHDNRMFVFHEGWVEFTRPSGHYGRRDFGEHDVSLDLKLLHYNPLTRPNQESPEYKPFKLESIKNLEEHPRHYMEKLIKE